MHLIRPSTLLILLCLLLLSPTACVASSPSMAPASSGNTALAPAATDSLLLRAKTLIQDATNKGSVDSLKQARALAERATNGGPHRALAHYYVALADYRMVNQLPRDAEERRTQVLEDAIGHLKRATKMDDQLADAWALLSGCYGQMMGMHPMRGMSLGPKSGEALKKAKTLAPNNPRVWVISGSQDFFAPSMFGGDKEAALKKFKKAARLAEKETGEDPLHPSWGHADAYAFIGLAHMNADRHEQARTAFEKALAINPDYGWVKSVLLPELEKTQS
jgi:tetratricopeptide (TPR) repeat protein